MVIQEVREPQKVMEKIQLCRAPVVMSVILATQETEIGGITVQSQPGQIVLQDPISKNPFAKKGWWSGSRCRP
jgi:hypothetical protein